VDREHEKLVQTFAEERAGLDAQHAENLEQARREGAAEALRRLAETLVNADLGREPSRSHSQRTAAPPSAPDAPPPGVSRARDVHAIEPIPAAEDDEAVAEEPWVDSALCTSCKDCTSINPRVFVFNENRQVVIGDARAGTYADIVRAAEKCPSRCIHPGKPLDPDEPGLNELIERAGPFN
jgi:ferredoxin